MEQIFITLSRAIEGAPAVAFGAAFAWGIASVVLSPCHLSSIPLIVGFIGSQGKMTTRQAFLTSSLFSLGILVTIAVIGVVTGLAGRMLGDVGRFGNYFVAAVFFIVGLHLLEVFSLPLTGHGPTSVKRKGLLAAFLLGLLFGIALGPCTFAYMMPLLAVSFKTAGTGLLYGVLLLVAYGIGHCAVIVLAGTSTELVERYLNWNEGSKGASILKKVCGVLVLFGGIYLIYTAR